MSIEKMSLVTIRGERGQLDEVLLRCLDSGVFHPESAGSLSEYSSALSVMKEENPYAALGKKLSAIALDADIDLGNTSFEGLDLQNKEIPGYIDKLDGKLKKLLSKKRGSEQLIDSHQKALQRLRHLTGLEDVNFDRLFSCKYIKLRFGRLPVESYQKLRSYSDRPFILLSSENDGGYVWSLYFCAIADVQEIDGLFHSLYFERVRVPDYAHGTPQEAIDFIEKDLQREQKVLEGIREEISSIAAGEKERVQKLYAKLCLLGKAFELRDKAASVKGDFVVLGYVPSKEAAAFEKSFAGLDKVAVTLKDPGEEPRLTVPVRLRNLAFVKPFEMFVDMYGLPSYQDLDPTPYVAFSYILLFGIMFGDLGQGLMVSLLGLFLYKKKGMAIGGIMSRIGLSSMVFGFLYGSVFGFEELLIPVHQALFGRPHLIQVMEGSYTNFLLLAAVGVGAVIIIISIGFNILLGLRRKDWERVFFSNNGLAGLVFYLAVLFAVVATMALGINVLTPLYIVPFFVVPLLLMFAKEPLGKICRGEKELFPEGVGGVVVETFFEMFEVLLSFVTNTMSFLRVGAFVLVHAGMMVVVFTLSNMVGGAGSVIVIIVGNIFVAAMEGLIVGIQVLRLEFYELFGRFYDDGGVAYGPKVIDYTARST